MALSYLESGNNTASTSWAISYPNASTGDIIIFNVGWDDSTDTTGLTPPAGPNGETAVVIEDVTASSSDSVRGKVVYYKATGTWTASTLTFTASASEQWSAVVVLVPAAEVHSTTPIGADNVFASTGTDATPDLPSLTAGSTDGGGTVVGFMVGDVDDPDGTITGWTERASTDRGAVGVGLWTRDTTATNSESIAAATGATFPSARDYVSFIYIIRPRVAPTVTTQAVSSIGLTTATGNGNVTDDGGGTITERGVCWNTSTNPTTSNSKATSGGTTGAFTASMTGLAAGTHYYVRAYAINSAGTSYGSNVEFDSQSAPTIALNSPADTATISDSTPTLEFTGTDADGDNVRYQVQVDTVNTFDGQPSITIVDNFETNDSSFQINGPGSVSQEALGQSFTTTSAYKVGKIGLYAKRNNSPSDNVYLEIRDSSITGTVLGTSDNVNAASLSSTLTWTYFTFSTPVSLSTATKYYMTVQRASTDTTNAPAIGRYQSTGYSGGGQIIKANGSWGAESGSSDVNFRICEALPLIDKLSGTDTGFVNTVSGGDTDPFNEGEKVSYTIQGPGSEVEDLAQNSSANSFGFGEFTNARYRGQIFAPTRSGTITTIGFARNKGSQGLKVYFDTVTGDAPTNAVGSELYSFTIPNADVIDEYGEYELPVPLAVTAGTRYCFYLAPWDTSGNAYADDYNDVRGVSATGGGQITNTNGTWSTENLTFQYKIYITVDDTLEDGTYYWRARAIDPSGSNTWSSWATTRSFTLTAGGGAQTDAFMSRRMLMGVGT